MKTLENYRTYIAQPKLLVATDCIVFGFDDGVLKLLVFRRRIDPFKGEWSLIGSFVDAEESVPDAARRVLLEFTGLENIFLEELKVYSDVDRDSGARCISIAQYALIRINDYDREQVELHGAKWFALEDIPQLVLDHNVMIADALDRLRQKTAHRPIGFELLPEKFTIPQLQSLYEAIHQTKLDDRNFRKKLLSFDLLIKLNEKDKSTSKKGAFLYRFDYDKYKRLEESGFNFIL
ncbi:MULTISPECIES: NUDIX domain-containing protein [Arenibacter]|uniref:NUDIX hydrolase n=1 Tax=Arenibacter TaxID=178469 RepID=UPI001C06CF69|nr:MULTISPECIES: NUDIX domain-containing protein [Arenibacter]MBU2904655.1 NUDIX domain-containing protein [Arenibacter algicola]MCK0133942.1 NUDIX domain-containing protein [Arenibacter sp. S6351L]